MKTVFFIQNCDNMKMINSIIIMFVVGLLACDKPAPIRPLPPPPPPPIVEKDSTFEIIWATRLDNTKEIVGTDNNQLYKDWLLTGGDIGDPPTIMAFNTGTGDKDWEYVHSGVVQGEIDVAKVIGNIYIGICSQGIVAIDLDTRQPLWEIDFVALNMGRGQKIIVRNDKFYNEIFVKNGSSYVHHIMEIDPKTGAYNSVYSSALEDTSPPVFWDSPEDGQTLMVFNSYPNNYDPPEQTTQNMLAVDMDTKEVVWKVTGFTENFASNVLHPPILYNDIVITGGDWSIYAFDVRTGEQLWRYAFDYPWAIWSKTNHLIHDGRLYVNNGQFDVTCLNPETGALIWNNPEGGPNCTDNMIYYEKEDLLVFTSWGYGSVMVLDALTGETVHREGPYADSQFNNDVVYDPEMDMFFTSTYKHAIGFKVHKP